MHPAEGSVLHTLQSTGSKTIPLKIRVSAGSAIILGLTDGLMNARPTTVYLLTFIEGKCRANCGFCSQARKSTSRVDLLSRVAWPVFDTQRVVSRLASAARAKVIGRICIQALNYDRVVSDLLYLAKEINQKAELPMSVSCPPLSKEELKKLVDMGVERIGISLDAATKTIFEKIKGALVGGIYDWEKHRDALRSAVEVFGESKVTTHLIVGLGETEKEMVELIQWCTDNHIRPSLFAFTPIAGTALELMPPPSIGQYRRIQLSRYLIQQGETSVEKMRFSPKGQITDFGVSRFHLEEAIQTGIPFITSGCPQCNRPYYNEKPSGPIYNYPETPTLQQKSIIKKQLGM